MTKMQSAHYYSLSKTIEAKMLYLNKIFDKPAKTVL